MKSPNSQEEKPHWCIRRRDGAEKQAEEAGEIAEEGIKPMQSRKIAGGNPVQAYYTPKSRKFTVLSRFGKYNLPAPKYNSFAPAD